MGLFNFSLATSTMPVGSMAQVMAVPYVNLFTNSVIQR
jgi:hypothetical protein